MTGGHAASTRGWALVVDRVVRRYDPSRRLARRLPMPVALGRVAIIPEAIRVPTKP